MIGKYKYDFNIPQNVKDLLNKLHTKYEAYIVGGCVRDLLLNKTPKDYDITTNATPEQIKEVFKGYALINNNGEKHGTITVRYNNENYEITTYRLDGEYTDHRHPDEVVFTSNLQEDLSRRDFTINALVYDGKYVIDYFGGINDLEHKLIKAVGEPRKRFEEDALRILRMVRFASVLDFDIDMDTLITASELAFELIHIAKERKTIECNKLVCGKGFTRLLLNVLVYNILEQVLPFEKPVYLNSSGSIYRIFNNPILKDRDYVLSYSLLFNRLSGRNVLFCYLVLSNEDKDKIRDICITHNEKLRIINDTNIKYLITKSLKELKHNDNEQYCRYIMSQAVKFAYAIGTINDEQVETIHKEFEDVLNYGCYSLKQLAINGNDLIELGLEPGPVIKDILEGYLNDVVEGKLENKKEFLLANAKQLVAKLH